MMDICNSGHCHKWQIMQEPSNYRVKSGVVDLVDVGRLQFVITALPTDQIPDYHKSKDAEGGSRAPIDNGVAEKEVLDDIVIPTTHTKADIENWPLPELRCKIILLIGIRNKGVIRRGHGNVKVDEVLEERRLIGTSVGRGNCKLLAHQAYHSYLNSRLSFQCASTFQCVKESLGLFSLVQVTSICLKPHCGKLTLPARR